MAISSRRPNGLILALFLLIIGCGPAVDLPPVSGGSTSTGDETPNPAVDLPPVYPEPETDSDGGSTGGESSSGGTESTGSETGDEIDMCEAVCDPISLNADAAALDACGCGCDYECSYEISGADTIQGSQYAVCGIPAEPMDIGTSIIRCLPIEVCMEVCDPANVSATDTDLITCGCEE